MFSKLKTLGKIVGIACLLYGFVCLGFYSNQDRFIFQSVSLPVNYEFSFDQSFTEYFILTPDSFQLNVLHFKSRLPSVPKGLILYFHGNAGNLQRWGKYAGDLTSLGYDVIMLDYRGYGKSTGEPSEENLYRDAQTVLDWSVQKFEPKKLILFGRSLGAAVATQLAIDAQPSLLILETPFDELSSVLYTLPSRYEFSNIRKLPAVTCRKLIVHGTDDGVVPLSAALRLKPLLNADDSFVVIEGGSHNNLREFDDYQHALQVFLK